MSEQADAYPRHEFKAKKGVERCAQQINKYPCGLPRDAHLPVPVPGGVAARKQEAGS